MATFELELAILFIAPRIPGYRKNFVNITFIKAPQVSGL